MTKTSSMLLNKIGPDKKAFTLLELIIVIAIMAVLSALLIPVVTGYIQKSDMTVDTANLRALNSVSQLYRLESDPITEDLFPGLMTDTERMTALVNSGYLDDVLTPRQKTMKFSWDVSTQIWILLTKAVPTTLNGVTMGTGGHKGFIKGSYNGLEDDLVMPLTLDGIDITHVYQDVFNGKGLTSVTFNDKTKITEIHARSFNNNALTEVVLPSSLSKLDYAAFNNNPITKVTIGANVVMESNVFRNNNAFRDAYYAQGAGTYVFSDGAWVKQP